MITKIKDYLKLRKIRKYIPDVRIADIFEGSYKTRPAIMGMGSNAIGKLFELDMKSGRIGIYKCIDNDGRGHDLDWDWYTLRFHDFMKYGERIEGKIPPLALMPREVKNYRDALAYIIKIKPYDIWIEKMVDDHKTLGKVCWYRIAGRRQNEPKKRNQKTNNSLE